MVKQTKIKQQSKAEAIHSEAVATSVMIYNDLSGHAKAAAGAAQPSYAMRYNSVHQPKGTDVWVCFTKFILDFRNTPPLQSNTLLSPLRVWSYF